MPPNFRRARSGEIRRFLAVFLLVSIAVLVIGLAGSFVALRRLEAQLVHYAPVPGGAWTVAVHKNMAVVHP